MKIQSKLKPKTNIDLTPLVDVVFTLLLFFILSYKEIKMHSHKLSLPQSNEAEQIKMDKKLPIIITIKKNGQLYLQNQKVNLNNIQMKLKNLLSKYDSLPELIISGGKDVPYHFIIKMIDISKSVGIKTINLRTQRMQKKNINKQ